MAKQVQIRRGSTASVSSFTGAEGELVYDNEADKLYVHDGATAGGILVGPVPIPEGLPSVVDTSITTMQSGTYVGQTLEEAFDAVPATTRAQMARVDAVLDLGLVPDNALTATASANRVALQAKIDSGYKGVIYFPEGFYHFDAPLVPKSGITFEGVNPEDAVLYWPTVIGGYSSAVSGFATTSFISDVTWRNLGFSQDFDPDDFEPALDEATTGQASLFKFGGAGSRRLEWERCRFYNVARHAIEATGPHHDMTVLRNTFEDISQAAVMVQPDVLVAGAPRSTNVSLNRVYRTGVSAFVMRGVNPSVSNNFVDQTGSRAKSASGEVSAALVMIQGVGCLLNGLTCIGAGAGIVKINAFDVGDVNLSEMGIPTSNFVTGVLVRGTDTTATGTAPAIEISDNCGGHTMVSDCVIDWSPNNPIIRVVGKPNGYTHPTSVKLSSATIRDIRASVGQRLLHVTGAARMQRLVMEDVDVQRLNHDSPVLVDAGASILELSIRGSRIGTEFTGAEVPFIARQGVGDVTITELKLVANAITGFSLGAAVGFEDDDLVRIAEMDFIDNDWPIGLTPEQQGLITLLRQRGLGALSGTVDATSVTFLAGAYEGQTLPQVIDSIVDPSANFLTTYTAARDAV